MKAGFPVEPENQRIIKLAHIITIQPIHTTWIKAAVLLAPESIAYLGILSQSPGGPGHFLLGLSK